MPRGCGEEKGLGTILEAVPPDTYTGPGSFFRLALVSQAAAPRNPLWRGVGEG